MIDTLTIYTMLKSKGFEAKQAEAITNAIASSSRTASIRSTKLDLIQIRFDLQMAIHSVKVDLQKSVHDRQMAEIKWTAGGIVFCFMAFIVLANSANL